MHQTPLDKDTLEIKEGTLQNMPNGVLFRSTNGRNCLFEDVRFRVGAWWIPRFTAYQFCNVVHISRTWAMQKINLALFAHEYGHLLQQKELGFWKYLWYVAVPSVWSIIRHPREHDRISIEKDATQRGMEYLSQHLL